MTALTPHHSTEAAAWADLHHPRQTSNDRWRIAAFSFDAGLAARTCSAEPERLTDPDDPRIRDGALVTVTFYPERDNATTYRYRVGPAPSGAGDVKHVRDCVRCADVRLLAEAPEPPHPDDAIIAVLATCGHDGQVLADLRDSGFDVVKAQS